MFFSVAYRVYVDGDIGVFVTEVFLGSPEGFGSGECWVGRFVGKDVALFNVIDEFGFLENLHYVGFNFTEDEVASFFIHVADEFFEGHDACCIHVVRIAHFKNNDFQVWIFADTPHLVSEEVGSAKEEFAFYVDNGDFRLFSFGGIGYLGELSIFIETVLDHLWAGNLFKEEYDREGDSDVDGCVEWQK